MKETSDEYISDESRSHPQSGYAQGEEEDAFEGSAVIEVIPGPRIVLR